MRQPLPAEVSGFIPLRLRTRTRSGPRPGRALYAGFASLRDNGSWEHVTNGLPSREVTSIREQGGLLLATVAASHCWYVSHDRGKSWEASAPTEFEVSGAVMQGGTLYVTTRHHGVLVREPEAAEGGLGLQKVAVR